MSSTKSVTDEMSVVYVYLNITETNSTFNGTMLRVFEKSNTLLNFKKKLNFKLIFRT